MAQSSISLPVDTLNLAGKKVPTHTFQWGTEGTVHAQGLFICDSSGNVVGATNNRMLVDGSGVTQPVSGTFWPATQPVSASALPLPSGAAQEHATAASPHSARLTDGTTYLGSTAQRLHVSDGGVPIGVSGPLTDTQLRASAVPMRAAKDTARTAVSFAIDGTIGIAAEALASISGVRGNAAVVGATTQTVTAAKTFRITAFRAVVMAGGTAVVNAKVRLRANYTGAVTVSSPVYAELRPGIISATAIANQVSPDETLVFPDGLEFPAGTSFGVSHVMTGTVTATQVSMTLVGFEY